MGMLVLIGPPLALWIAIFAIAKYNDRLDGPETW
jgi:hypothetical protein